ncbi:MULTISPECIES: hypothetical protein [unclassified Pseudomonas]|uniref:hypothetical protein n=1 Tax=unclassified Pseudomonas TaxID=196821 RepID=UPI000BD13256|nr:MULTISPECIES: hypothetical protein [unclassified Pseudomonas]PVZ16322.1 hypothetical protein F474_01838 [Pseudomonas sp. URIL14HWK12:I12]PVZ25822.1 hypothetical protein F470_01272 [Pseudomonas sp. URIL14HWK12:I10]PVZ36654.1 hypothetical protein F472_01838 [Pseudomonas sp. URIL14HWK12:I11]SNZ12885.1 hypothetical protein SAMN05660463_02249 [Pseudomonas sp. URIL14HWK12:I9]
MPAAFSRPRLLTLAASLALGLAGLGNAHAAPATQAAAKPAAATNQAQTVSALNGKFSFTLPAGFAATALPAGTEQSGTAGAKGTMYMNQAQRRVVMVTEVPIPNGATTGDNDDEFLSGASEGFIKQQSQALPDFKKTGQKRLALGSLGIEQVDSTASMGGGPTRSSTFLAGSGPTMALVQVISKANDEAGHQALVKAITHGK